MSDFESRPPARPAALRAALGRVVAELVRVRARLVALNAKAARTDAAIDAMLVPIIGPANVKTRLAALFASGKVSQLHISEAVARGWITQADATEILGVAP